MNAVPSPRWREFITVKVLATWTEESVEDVWEIQPLMVEGQSGPRLLVSGRLVLAEAMHCIEVMTALSSDVLAPVEVESLRDSAVREAVGQAVSGLVHSKAYSLAMAAAALVEVNLPQRTVAPDPVIKGA